MNYRSIRRRLSYFFFFCTVCIFGQNVTISGKAHEWYKDKRVELWQIADFVTMNRLPETADTVDSDGSFELQIHVLSTRPVYLRVGNVTAQLYVGPGMEYLVNLPEPDESKNVNKDVDLPINIGIVGADSTELNALVFDFQRLYNKLFIPSDDRYLGRAAMFRRADSLQRLCEARYRAIDNPYFKTYVTYFIASLNSAVSRGEDYLISRYIIGKPILYNHYEYMRFFASCFQGYMKGIAARYPGQSLYNIINDRADLARLDAFLRRDKHMASDSLRELVTLFNLWEFYFSAEFNRDAVESLVSQLSMKTAITGHRAIARNMLAFFGRLQVGSTAPDFSARTREGRIGSLSMFKGRWVYLNFFSTSNTGSMREMMKIADLRRRYGHKVVFLSVCLDDSLRIYKKFLAENPKYDWQIWYNNDRSLTRTAKEHYAVTGTEAYFLIGNLGEIVQNPALSPSEGIEYKFNVIFRIRARPSKTGLR